MFMPFLLINKPKGWTSHDVVGYLRKVTGVKKIGHAGTLDPFATGLLIVGIGREATKRLDEFKSLPKTYIAMLKLGAVSDTYDSTGIIAAPRRKVGTKLDSCNVNPATDKVKQTLKKFIGKQKQLPPMYSAKKIKGKKLYELARKGVEVERKPHDIEIYDIKLLEYKDQMLKIKCKVSVGTYIRALAHDIGKALGTGAYCDELERTAIGDYSVDNALTPKKDDDLIKAKIIVNKSTPHFLKK